MKKKREYSSSELVKSFAKIYGFEDKLLAFEIKDYLKEYLANELYSEIISVNISKKTVIIKIQSPLLKNDFRLRRSFYLKKFQENFGEDQLDNLEII